MENQETFTMLDEFGQEQVATILNVVEINHQEYLVYSISKNEEEDSIYVKKIIKEPNGEENLISIEDEEEKRVVFESIQTIIEELD